MRNVVIFDLDETLMVEHRSVEVAFEEACEPAVAKHGVDAAALAEAVRRRGRELWRQSPMHGWCKQVGISSWEGLSGDLGGEGKELRALQRWAAGSRYRTEAWRQALADLGVADGLLAGALAERVAEVRGEHHVLFPESREVLEALRGRCRLALLTNGAPRIQREKIERVGIEDYFEAVVISGEVGIGKPDPRVFRLTLERMGAARAEAAMVGNSLRRDIAGANAFGIRSIWVNRTGQPSDKMIRPDAEVADLRELETARA